MVKPFDKNKDKNKVEPNWEKGVWLGSPRESNETLVGTRSGVIRCYSIKRMAVDDKWDKDLVMSMQGTPQQPNPSKIGLRIPVRIEVEGEPVGEASGLPQGFPEGEIPPVPEETPAPLVRRAPITYKEVEKYGPTPGCIGCHAKTKGEVTRRGHSENAGKEWKN